MAYRDEVLADGPKLYWRLGETSGTTAADETANALSGTYDGTPRLGVAGGLAGDANTAVEFHRADATDSITRADSAALDTGDVFSVECIFKRAAHSGVNESLFSKGSGSYVVRINTSGGILLRKFGTADIVTSTINITDTDYHHLIVTKSGATSKIWIDGVDRTGTVTDATLVNTTVTFQAARNQSSIPEYYGGVLDEVALYGVALSQARIQAHYSAMLVTESVGMLVGS